MKRALPSPRSPAARLLAALLLPALFWVVFATVVPRLHACCHHDDGEDAAHQCAVTLFAGGAVDAAPVDVSLPAPPATPYHASAARGVGADPRFSDCPPRPGRAPPVQAS